MFKRVMLLGVLVLVGTNAEALTCKHGEMLRPSQNVCISKKSKEAHTIRAMHQKAARKNKDVTTSGTITPDLEPEGPAEPPTSGIDFDFPALKKPQAFDVLPQWDGTVELPQWYAGKQ